ncbi:MAG: pyridoxal-phosphate dependent enzyme, partial [bacterium]|nr:pyridoxal-phosphate dependent enzyme [bacterium]
MPSSELALERKFPKLATGLARCAFLDVPTPVETLALEGIAPGQLFVKRDDRCCRLYGGNKPRKLEFVIGQALERGTRRLVTTGGLGTNHGLATTILAREVGLATTLVLVDQPITPGVRESLRLFLSYGAEVIHGRNVPGAAAAVVRVLLRATLAGERPQLVPSGGSSSHANLGFVSAGLELGEQVKAGELPEPRELYVAVGTGGTLAGLALGLRLAGLSTRVVGVRVSDILPPSPRRLAKASDAALGRLRRIDPGIPAAKMSVSGFDMALGQHGDGSGAATPEAEPAG